MCENYEALSRAFKRLRKLCAVYLIAAAAALALYFVNRWATLAALAVCLIFYVFVVRPASRSYSRSFVHVCAQATLDHHLTQAVHTQEPVLDLREIGGAALMPANSGKGGMLCHQGGSGQYRGRRVTMGDVTFTHSYATPRGKTRHQFTNGLYVIVELERDSGLDCRILLSNAAEEGSIKKMLRSAPLVRLSGGEGSDWSIICSKGNRALPGEAFMEAVGKLDKAVEGWGAVCLRGSQLHVYLIDRLLGQRVNSRYAPDAAVERADLVPELDQALRLSDCV